MSKTIGNNNTIPPGDGGEQRHTLQSGDTLGQYKVIRLLGRGGMGEVYEVEHNTLEKRFALKLLPEDFGQNKNALERFRREAKVMANLEHRNILSVDDFGEIDGRYWLRMELINTLTAEDEDTGKRCDVGSLQELGDFCNGKIPKDVLLPIIKQVAEGLAYAHEKGAIHRDLKPGNILLQANAQDEDATPTAKIADFGLVRVVGEEWMRSQAQRSVSQSMSLGDQATEAPEGGTSTKALLGTYEYMSPEQKNGEEADQRSDIYALGLIIYRLLTGEREATFDLPTDLNPDLSPVWDEIVKDSLQSRRERRINDCGTILQKLKDLKTSQQTKKEKSATTSKKHDSTDQLYSDRKGSLEGEMPRQSGESSDTSGSSPLKQLKTRTDLWRFSIWGLVIPYVVFTFVLLGSGGNDLVAGRAFIPNALVLTIGSVLSGIRVVRTSTVCFLGAAGQVTVPFFVLAQGFDDWSAVGALVGVSLIIIITPFSILGVLVRRFERRRKEAEQSY